MKKQKLTVSGHLVQHAYMVQCLRLVHEFGALRVLTIAYAMFPSRAQKAASAAAKRVVSNALRLRYLECAIQPDSRRYYALTLRGARVLHSADDSYRVRSTTKALMFYRHEHREWCNVVALAARHRGLNSLSEAQIVGAVHSAIVSIFGHVPDAVTYHVDEGEPSAAWHEIELSRRSTSGAKKLAHLVHTLIEKRYLTHDNQEHNINLVMHCATAKIERENHRVIRTALVDCCALNKNMNLQEAEEEHQSPAFALQISSNNRPVRWFMVYIDLLPASVELAWGSELPWPGATGIVSSDVDVFLQPVEP